MKPDYNGGSIVNLMSSIAKALGTKTKYKTLRILPPEQIKAKNTVLIIIDGLGYNYIMAKCKGTVFQEHLKGKMTSVFPATTSSAITTFATGEGPQQHAIIGWFMLLKEIGIVCTTLRFTTRAGKTPLSTMGVKIKDIFEIESFSKKLNCKSYAIKPKEIMNSEYSKLAFNKSKMIGYTTLNGFFKQITKTIKSDTRKKYIYAYWPQFDALCHKKGVENKKTEKHFRELDAGIRKFLRKIENTNTQVIITADHGLVDTKTIQLENHPKLKSCLTMPLCGDGRSKHCYVHPSKTKEFKKYVKTKLGKYCELHNSSEMIKQKYFGLGKTNPKLKDRIGDYMLIMKKKYAMDDSIIGTKKSINIGHHGGESEDEMIVPLIVISMKKLRTKKVTKNS